jgi:hypothetical protein
MCSWLLLMLLFINISATSTLLSSQNFAEDENTGSKMGLLGSREESIRRQRGCICICDYMRQNCVNNPYSDALLLCSGLSIEGSCQIVCPGCKLASIKFMILQCLWRVQCLWRTAPFLRWKLTWFYDNGFQGWRRGNGKWILRWVAEYKSKREPGRWSMHTPSHKLHMSKCWVSSLLSCKNNDGGSATDRTGCSVRTVRTSFNMRGSTKRRGREEWWQRNCNDWTKKGFRWKGGARRRMSLKGEKCI